MSLWDAGGLWLTSFLQVLLMGFQSRNVNEGHYVAAAGTSATLAAAQILLVKSQAALPFWYLFAIIGTSGPAGIVCAMLLFRYTLGRRKTSVTA